MKRYLLCLCLGGFVGHISFAQSNDSRIEKAKRAQKKADEAQMRANKAENMRAKLMGLKEKKTTLHQSKEEKAQTDKMVLEKFRRRLKFLENNVNNPALKYKPGPGGAAERIGSPGYRTPSNNTERREARVAQAYPKRNNN